MGKRKFQVEGTAYAKTQVRNKAVCVKGTDRGQITKGFDVLPMEFGVFPVDEGSHKGDLSSGVTASEFLFQKDNLVVA